MILFIFSNILFIYNVNIYYKMSYFNRLQQQAQAYSGFAERGAEQIQNFDRDKLIAQGQAAAYRQGHQLMEGIVGQEVAQGLREGIPTLYRTGRALSQRARGMPTSRRPEQPTGQDENLPQGRAEPPAAPSYEEAISSQARLAEERVRQLGGGRTTGEARNLTYNTGTGRVEDESGNPVAFGAERESQFRTPLEQEQFDNPNAGQRPVGRVPDREDFGDTDLTSRGANARANQTFRDTQQAIARQRANQPQPQAERPPISQDIDEGVRSRGAYGSQATQPLTETQRQGLPNLDELKAAQAAREAPVQVAEDNRFRPTSRATPVERETRSIESLQEKYRNVDDKLPIGAKEKFTPREEPEGLDLEDIPSVRINQPTPLGVSTQPALVRPTRAAPEPPAPQLERGEARLAELERQEPPEPTARITQPTAQQARDLEGRQAEPERPPPSFDEGEQEEENMGSKIAGDIGKTETSLAPEEEVADAIPGIGEILGAGLAIGGAIAGIAEAEKSASDKPPQQPQGPVAPQLAFSSAPVIDSDDYHNK